MTTGGRVLVEPDHLDRTDELRLPIFAPSTDSDSVPVSAPAVAASRQPANGAARARRPGRSRLVGATALGTVAVLLLAVMLTGILRDRDVDGVAERAGQGPAPAVTDVSTSADPAPVTVTETAAEPEVVPPVVEPAPTTSPTSSPAPVAPVVEDIACVEGGWVVQLASGKDQAAYDQRVTELRAAGQLPDGAKTARTDSSCAIFAAQTNTVVLWAGPFASAAEACPARLAGPPDAFIKGTTPETGRTYFSCLCPADVAALPTLDGSSQPQMWVGELQRVLGNRLNISIEDLPGNWGTFTAGTAQAVVTFQTSSGLPPTGTVDQATWAALIQAQC